VVDLRLDFGVKVNPDGETTRIVLASIPLLLWNDTT